MQRIVIIFGFALALLQSPARADMVLSSVPGQVGVYKVSLDEGSPLKHGDIVVVLHDGKPVGEARLTRCSDGTATIDIKGVFPVCQLDQVVARDATPGTEPVSPAATSSAPEASPDAANSLVSAPSSTTSKVMRSKHPVRGGTRPASQEGHGSIPNLDYTVLSYIAETGYIRAQVKIENVGSAASRSTRAVCVFTDWFGKSFSSDWMPVPALKPGEFVTSTMFALVAEEEAPSQNWRAEVRFGEYGRASRPAALQRKTQMSKPRKMLPSDKARRTWSMPRSTL